MHICRTSFKGDIITEFIPPKDKKSNKIIIFCSGIPSVPNKDDVLEFWAQKGYWTFFPRYRGTWESKGTFLRYSLERDLLSVIDCLNERFMDFWSAKTFKVKSKHITIVGSSFGGPAAILATLDERVNKAVCISPVVDWLAEDKIDPLDNLYNFLTMAYPNVYRLNKNIWNKLKNGKFYNPAAVRQKLDPKKICIFHAKDDDIVHYKPVANFARNINCTLYSFKKGGHLSSSLLLEKKNYNRMKKFITT